MKENFDGLVQHLLDGGIFLGEAIELLEKSMIAGALGRNRGNQSAASKQLGIHRNTLQRKLAEYEIGSGRPHVRRKPAARISRARKSRSAAA